MRPKGRVKWFSRDKAIGVWSAVIIVLNCATRGGLTRHDELIGASAIVTFQSMTKVSILEKIL